MMNQDKFINQNNCYHIASKQPEVKQQGGEWRPISEATKDNTTIEIYWFATTLFLIGHWEEETKRWESLDGCNAIPGHVKKAIFRPVIHHKYEDYKHFFTEDNKI